MKKKALLIFLNSNDVNEYKNNEVYDKTKIERIDVGDMSNAHPDTGEYKEQVNAIQVVTWIAEKIAHFLNECDKENFKGYISIEKLPPVIQMWTMLSLSREKEIKFVKISQ